MLPALHDDERRALARLATMLIAGALCVLPLTAQNSPSAGAAGVHDITSVPNLVPPERLTFPAYEINRDPFVPQGAMRVKLEGSTVPMSVGPSDDIGVVLPPNAGASQGGAPPSIPGGLVVGPVVRAIVLGDPPRALVEAGGTVRVLGVGDRLGALTVAGIVPGRVILSDGSALMLGDAHK
ncbi:MAG TPA: hypothetical protein VMB20_09185 [Candidatus Acidoferrum sp.]|nr:hypothetical protein [Candidatus Acidoferrum sp.]